MTQTKLDLSQAPILSILNALRNAMFRHADLIRCREESFIRTGVHPGWSEEAAHRFRTLTAGGAVLEHCVAEATKAEVDKKSTPDWVARIAGQVRGALSAALPEPTPLPTSEENDDAA